MANEVKLTITADDKTQGAIKSSLASLDSLKGGVTKTAFEFAVLATAAEKAISYIGKGFEILKHGAKELQVEAAFKNVAKHYKEDADEIVKAMKRASAGTIEDSALMQKAIKGMTQDLSAQDMIKIAEIARVTARTTGQSVTEAFDSIADAIANKTPKALVKLGLVSKQEMKVLNDAIEKGVEGTTMLDLAFIQAKKSGEAMGGMAKNEAEHIQTMSAAYVEAYDEMTKAAIKYFNAVFNASGGEMGLSGAFGSKPLNTGVTSDPKASEGSGYWARRKAKDAEERIAKTKAKEAAEERRKEAEREHKADLKQAEQFSREFELARGYSGEDSEYEKVQAAIRVQQNQTTIDKLEQDRRQNEMDELVKSSEYKEALAQNEHTRALANINELTEWDIEYAENHLTLIEGMSAGWKKWKEEVENDGVTGFKLMQKMLEETSEALTKFVMTGKLDFKSLANSIIHDLIKIQIQKMITASVDSASGAGGQNGWIGTAFSVVGSWFASTPASAKGNVFDMGRLQPFAYGGIVDRPTVFPMAHGAGLMGEAGPEAVMPLKRGADGKLGVSGTGLGGGMSIGNLNVYALDTQSFADVCKRNPSAVIAPFVEAMKSNSSLRYVMKDLLGDD
jgi:lambda family phage tail tape measure protein